MPEPSVHTPPARTWKAAIVRRLKRMLVIFALFGLAYLIYPRLFTPEAEDWPGQRTSLGGRKIAAAPLKFDRDQLLADVRELASEKYAGRGLGSDGSRLARDYLISRLRSIGVQPLLADFSQPFEFRRRRIRQFWTGGIAANGVNLLAQIPGSAVPEQRLLLAAHYDHLGTRDGTSFPGADDNASGVAALLAAATYFKAHPPRHTIVFALFDAEEAGLAGAKHFVASTPIPLASIRLMLNMDMIARSPSGELFVVGTHQRPELRRLTDPLRAVAPIVVLYGHDRPRPYWDSNDWTRSSDHAPFHDAGVPFLYLGVPDHAGYHRPADTFDAITPDFFVASSSFALDLLLAADRGD